MSHRLVLTQVANVFACRSESTPARLRDVLSNCLIVCGVAAELLLMAAIDDLRFGHSALGTAALPIGPWLVAVVFLPVLLLIDRAAKRAAKTGHRHGGTDKKVEARAHSTSDDSPDVCS